MQDVIKKIKRDIMDVVMLSSVLYVGLPESSVGSSDIPVTLKDRLVEVCGVDVINNKDVWSQIKNCKKKCAEEPLAPWYPQRW